MEGSNQSVSDDGARGRPGEHLDLTWSVKQHIPEVGGEGGREGGRERGKRRRCLD